MQDDPQHASMKSFKETQREGKKKAKAINDKYKRQGEDKQVVLDEDYRPTVLLRKTPQDPS